jgi:RimJ/RimL family protein N-acetyltransferase
MISLRHLTTADAASFRRLRLIALEESPAAFEASFSQEEKMDASEFARRLEEGPGRWIIGAFQDAELLGMVGFARQRGDKTCHKGLIWGMYVIPQLRGRGIGRRLLIETLTRAEALPGLRSVHLSVVTSNLSALRLYESFGFVRYGEEEDALCVNGRFHSMYHMARKINIS